MFTQFSIAAATVSIVTTLEAASKWPPLVTLASGLFFMAAVGRSGAMWCAPRSSWEDRKCLCVYVYVCVCVLHVLLIQGRPLTCHWRRHLLSL